MGKKLRQLVAATLLLSMVTPNLLDSTKAFAETNKSKVNIAEGKRVYGRDDHNNQILEYAVDGNINTYWDGGQYPSYLEVDLEKVYNLDSINLVNYADGERYYKYTVYSSVDGVNFNKIAEKNNESIATNDGDTHELGNSVQARYLRVSMEYCSANEAAHISEFRVFGEETGETGSVPAPINVPNFEDTKFAAPITSEETMSEVTGIIERRLGSEYLNWFEFEISQSENNMDYFELSNGTNGKIKIKGNNGVSLATGLNHYLKYYCKVHISQAGDQVKMPEVAPTLEAPIKKETPFESRYAFNYCTFSYSMAFWDKAQWQAGLDWLALNGVNLVLDITGQDEVWRRFLTKLGYDITEIKNWLVGPGYMAWQHMGNMTTFGGPLPDQWFEDRTELARTMQRKMKSLGMDVVLQGFSGMVPADIQDKKPGIDILPQGEWCSFERPAMLKTDSNDYDEIARLFYQSQEEVFGANATDYYATDPFHEGGSDGGMSRGTIYSEMLNSMEEYDPDAVWVIQSWRENPAQAGLDGIEEARRDKLLILDLYAELDPRWIGKSNIWGYQWDSPEFDQTPWIWSMLNNFGGKLGIHGQLDVLATEIPKAYETSTASQSKMKGIGMTPEGIGTNPVLYDLLFEMAWNTEEVNIDEWLREYVERRYGEFSESAYEAWQVFNDTAYAKRTDYHEGAPESVINARPKFGVTSSAAYGSAKVPYNKVDFEKAVELLLADYDKLKNSPAYLYDVADFLRQVLSNSSQEYYKKFTTLYNSGDYVGFEEYANKFLEIINLQEQILSTQESFLVGNWINDAKEIAYDDFSTDMFELNARALITTWGAVQQAEAGELRDYANKQWAGLTKDLYYSRWEKWINSLKEAIATENSPASIDWFEHDWNWVLEDKVYPTEPSNLDLKELGTKVFENYTTTEVTKPDPLAIPQSQMVATATSEETGVGQEGFASYAIDGDDTTIWHTKWDEPNTLPHSITLDLGGEYNINKLSYHPRLVGTNGNITKYTVEVSTDGSNFTKVTEGELASNGALKFINFDATTATHLRLTALEGVAGFVTAAELNVMRTPDTVVDKSELKALIDSASSLNSENYTDESFANLSVALESANTVFGNDNATLEEVNEAKTNLQTAIDNLVLKEIKVSKISNLSANKFKNAIELSWDAPKHTTGLTEYIIYKDGKIADTISSENRTIVLDDLKANTIYNLKVVASYSNGKKSRPVSKTVRALK